MSPVNVAPATQNFFTTTLRLIAPSCLSEMIAISRDAPVTVDGNPTPRALCPPAHGRLFTAQTAGKGIRASQWRTASPPPCCPWAPTNGRWRDAELPGSRHIDDQLELGGLHYRQVGGVFSSASPRCRTSAAKASSSSCSVLAHERLICLSGSAGSRACLRAKG